MQVAASAEAAATFSNCGDTLKLLETAATGMENLPCSRRGNTPSDGNTSMRYVGNPQPSTVQSSGEGTQTVRKGAEQSA